MRTEHQTFPASLLRPWWPTVVDCRCGIQFVSAAYQNVMQVILGTEFDGVRRLECIEFKATHVPSGTVGVTRYDIPDLLDSTYTARQS